eukprot:CAMPEP_0179174896 /NCGR_PEP_ID=MMETSP0796-20121207/86358_1 /TAXON_ID=73915 /ORGANISM="Pyrodinium bahamense, Strain pbaha01" /LENGTH=114 /DNA_ID=CAMNT_0020878205 /DNA_START=915 /DNA_END=1260 /DNA_ORIENTATION=-
MTNEGLLKINLTTSLCSVNHEADDGFGGSDTAGGMIWCNRKATDSEMADTPMCATRQPASPVALLVDKAQQELLPEGGRKSDAERRGAPDAAAKDQQPPGREIAQQQAPDWQGQ